MPQEGAIRTNNGIREIYTPEGLWRTVTPTEEAFQVKPTGFTPKEQIIVGPEDAEQQTTEDLDALAETEEEREKIRVYSPTEGVKTIVKEDLPSWLDRGYTTNIPEPFTKPGEQLTAEEKSEFGLGEDEEKSQEELDLEAKIVEYDKEMTDYLSELEDLRISRKDASNNYIESIKGIFAQKRSAMEDINKRAIASIRTFGIRMGTARYAPTVALGIVSSEERAGQMRLADLNVQEASLIAEAKMARDDKDYELLNEKMGLVKGIRQEKIDKLKKLQITAMEHNKKLQEERNKVVKENNMLIAWDKGNKDYNSLFTAINYDEEGNLTGDYSPDEIEDFLGRVAEEEELADFTDIEKKKLEQAGLLDSTRQEQLDFLFGEAEKGELERSDTQVMKVMGQTGKTKEEVESLSDEDFASYLYSDPESGFFKFSNSDRGKLMAAGLTPADIITIRNDILTSGIDEVLQTGRGLTQAQIDIIRNILERGSEDAAIPNSWGPGD